MSSPQVGRPGSQEGRVMAWLFGRGPPVFEGGGALLMPDALLTPEITGAEPVPVGPPDPPVGLEIGKLVGKSSQSVASPQ